MQISEAGMYVSPRRALYDSVISPVQLSTTTQPPPWPKTESTI